MFTVKIIFCHKYLLNFRQNYNNYQMESIDNKMLKKIKKRRGVRCFTQKISYLLVATTPFQKHWNACKAKTNFKRCKIYFCNLKINY